MIRNLKKLGLALVAVFAMSALSASTASAVDHFTNGLGAAEPALLTGVGHNHVFTIPHNDKKFECTTAKFAGTALNGSTEATAEASYNGTPLVTPHTHHCASSNGEVTIDMNGCHYKLTGNTTGDDPGVNDDATIWIQCPGAPITITGEFGVEITVPSQTPTIGGVTYTEVSHGGKKGVAVKATVTGITFSCHPTFFCTIGGVTHHNNNAQYTGDVTVTGYEDKNANTTTLTPASEGAKVDIEVS